MPTKNEPTKAEKQIAINAAKKMGCKICRNIRWYDNGVRSRQVFRVLDMNHVPALWDKDFPNEYEAALAYLKQELMR